MALGYGRVSTNNFSTAKFIVDTNGIQSGATHSTIASAITDASSGETIFIKPGIYTEDFTLKSGVNIASFSSDGVSPTVTISGKVTASYTGRASICGIRLQTNSDFAVVISGANDTYLYLKNCFIYALNNTAISYTTTGNSKLWLYYCIGDIGTTGISYAAMTGACTGTLKFLHCYLENNAGSTTPSTNASTAGGGLAFEYSYFGTGITTSNSAIFEFIYSQTSSGSSCPIITGGTGSASISQSYIFSGTSAALSVGSGTTVKASNLIINSTNANPITGAGTLNISEVEFINSGTGINTSTTTWNVTKTGIDSTAYAVLCGPTSSPGLAQSIASVGTSGQVLTSNGAAALPTFQAAAGDVSGGGSSTDNALARWSGTGGDTLQDSTVIVTDNGEMTNASQPSFLAYLASSDTNATGNATTYLYGDTDTNTALTEVFDQGSDFVTGSSSGASFTAPVTGRYLLTLQATMSNASSATEITPEITTSNRDYVRKTTLPASSGTISQSINVVADLDASDTVLWKINVAGMAGNTGTVLGTSQMRNSMSGCLLA